MALQPVAPTLSAIAVNGFKIDVNADGNPAPPATFYAFEVIIGTETKFVGSLGSLQDTKVFLPVLSITITNATPNTLHSVRLSAADDAAGLNESVVGPSAGATTLAADPLAQPYTNIFSTTVMANWGANSNPTGTEYEVQLSPDSNFLFGVVTSGIITETGFIFINLLPTTTFFGRVRARNSVGALTSFVSLGSVLTATGPDTVKIIRVFNLLAERGFHITWQPNQETNIASYNIYRSESPTDPAGFVLLGSVPTPITSFDDFQPFTFGVVFYYLVTAVDDGGNESSIDLTTPAHENTFHSFEEQPFPNTLSHLNLVKDEIPLGAVDDANVLFTTAFSFRKDSVEVYLNGVKLLKTTDFAEGPLAQQITFTDPPNTGSTVTVNYVKFL